MPFMRAPSCATGPLVNRSIVAPRGRSEDRRLRTAHRPSEGRRLPEARNPSAPQPLVILGGVDVTQTPWVGDGHVQDIGFTRPDDGLGALLQRGGPERREKRPVI